MEDHLSPGLSFPIKEASAEECFDAQKADTGGAFPLGQKNQTWHAGIHLATDKPIVAIANGTVVAYRFKEDVFTNEVGSMPYSNSFVLVKHTWNSAIGNRLDYYSLYMHLDPQPSGEFLPDFLADSKWTANRTYTKSGKNKYGADDTVQGHILFKKEGGYNSSHTLVPNGAKVTVGEDFSVKEKRYRNVTFVGCDGVTYEGVFRIKTGEEVTKSTDGVVHVIGGSSTHTYIDKNKITQSWKCFNDKGGFGIVIRNACSNDTGVAVGFIPNGVEVVYEAVGGVEGWGKLKSPIPETILPGPYFIKTGRLKRETVKRADTSKLGQLVVPAPNERPEVKAGEVIGKPYKHRHIDMAFIHHEVFTLDDMFAEMSVLNDPKRERYFATESRYVVPAGTETISGLANVSLKKGDYVKKLEDGGNSDHIRIKVEGIVRTVQKKWLNDPNKKALCKYLNKQDYYYSPKELSILNDLMNGWVVPGDIFYRNKIISGASRELFLPCVDKKLEFWIHRDITVDAESKLKADPKVVFKTEPKVGKTDQCLTLNDPRRFRYNNKTWAVTDNGMLIDITNVEPETPFTWPGFELIYEDADSTKDDAFMDIDKCVTSMRLDNKTSPTKTADEMRQAIVNNGKFDIAKIAQDPDWKRRLSQLIVRCPSEWHYSDDKYSRLPDIMGVDPESSVVEREKSLIQKTAFWDKLAGVFDDKAPENGKQGKEIFAFHPIAFVTQLNLLAESGMEAAQVAQVTALAQMVRGAIGEDWSNETACRALAAVFVNRLSRYEWSKYTEFVKMVADPLLPGLKGLTEEEKEKMLPWISDVFRKKGWSGLPKQYVHFHHKTQTLDSLPWDTSVLSKKTLNTGNFVFYCYSGKPQNFATELTIKFLKLISGGEHGVSEPCIPGKTLARKVDGSQDTKPYRYDKKTSPKWEMEYAFTIAKGTEQQEKEKESIFWMLRYFTEVDGQLKEHTNVLGCQDNRFSFSVPAEASGYFVELVPVTMLSGKLEPIDSEIGIGLRRREHLLFNGKSLQWMSEEGEPIPFHTGSPQAGVKQLKAFTGFPPPETACHANPMPEGNWRVKPANFRSSYDLTRKVWEPWWPQVDEALLKGIYLLEPEGSDAQKDSAKRFLLGTGESDSQVGNIHLYDEKAGYDSMEVFANTFTDRVAFDIGGMLLKVNYTIRKRQILELALDAKAGDSSAEQILNEARSILREWGFPTGALGVEQAVRNTADPKARMVLVCGDSNSQIEYLQASAKQALDASDEEIREREAVFSGDGRISRTVPGGTERTIQIDINENAANWAGRVNVTRAEALAKIDWKLWSALIDAAFETDGLETIVISGAWRPYEGLDTFQGALQGKSNISGGKRFLTWDEVMKSPHIKGRGLDVSLLNKIAMFNDKLNNEQPKLAEQYSVKLKEGG